MLVNVTYRFNCCLAHAAIFKPIHSGTNLDWDFFLAFVSNKILLLLLLLLILLLLWFVFAIAMLISFHSVVVCSLWSLTCFYETIVKTDRWTFASHSIFHYSKNHRYEYFILMKIMRLPLFAYLMVFSWPLLCIEMISIWTCIHVFEKKWFYLTLKRITAKACSE